MGQLELMQRQVEDWRKTQISDERAKLILYAGLGTEAGSAPNARSCALTHGRSPEGTYALNAGPASILRILSVPCVYVTDSK